MNLFVLSDDWEQNARWHVDRHVTKMPLEAAQILCTIRHLTFDPTPIKYKATHVNHPVVKWARASSSNYFWVCAYGLALCKEYTHRYGKTHACEAVIQDCWNNLPPLPVIGYTEHVQAMPDDCKVPGSVYAAYQNYYIQYKKHLFKWTKREPPRWLEKYL